MAGNRNLGRHRQRAQPVHCRATVNIGWKGLRFSPNFWFEIGGRMCLAKHPFLVRQQCWKGWRRCGERISFLVRRKQERHRAGGKQRRAKNGGNDPGQGVGQKQKPWTASAAGTARPLPRCWGGVVLRKVCISHQTFGVLISCRRCGAEVAFFIKLLARG